MNDSFNSIEALLDEKERELELDSSLVTIDDIPEGGDEESELLQQIEAQLGDAQYNPYGTSDSADDRLGIGMGAATYAVDSPLITRPFTRPLLAGLDYLDRQISGRPPGDPEMGDPNYSLEGWPFSMDPIYDREDFTPEGNIAGVYSEIVTESIPFAMAPKLVARSVKTGMEVLGKLKPEHLSKALDARKGIKTARGASQREGFRNRLSGAASDYKLRAAASIFPTGRSAQMLDDMPGVIPSHATAGGMWPTFMVKAAETQLKNPRAYAASEASVIGGAAFAGAVAESYDPGNIPLRVTAEIIGPAVNIPSLTVRGGLALLEPAKQLATRAFRAGKPDEAAYAISKIIEKSGGDVGEAMARLDSALEQHRRLGLAPLPAGDISGDPVLIAIQRRLQSNVIEFDDAVIKRRRAYTESLQETHDALMRSGDPQLVEAAADLRLMHFENSLNERLNTAQLQVASELRKLTPEETLDPKRLAEIRTNASKKAHEIMTGALKDARRVETKLYDAVDLDIPMSPSKNLAEELRKQNRYKPKEVKIPMNDTASKLATSNHSFGQLKELRTELMSQRGRIKSSGGDTWRHDKLIAAINRDMDALDDPAVQYARDFSRTLNDVYTRTFIGRAQGVRRTGEARISPEELLDQAFSGSRTGAARNFRQLREGEEFADEELPAIIDTLYGEGSAMAVGFRGGRDASMLGEQEAFLRTLSDRFVDEDGTVNVNRLVRFVNDNPSMLDDFPILRGELREVESAANLLKNVEASNSRLTKHFLEDSILAKITGSKRPTEAVERSLRGPDPQSQFRLLANTVKKYEENLPGAIAGLRRAVIQDAYSKSHKGDNFSWIEYKRVLNEPITDGGPSRLEMMRMYGVMDESQKTALDSMLEVGIRVENAIEDPSKMGQLLDDPSAFTLMAVSALGTRAATSAGKITGIVGKGEAGPSLVLAQRGASMAREFFAKTPLSNKTRIMAELMNDPEALSAAMKQLDPQSEEWGKVLRTMNSWLFGATTPGRDVMDGQDIPEMWYEDTVGSRGSNDITEDDLEALERTLREQQEAMERSIGPY